MWWLTIADAWAAVSVEGGVVRVDGVTVAEGARGAVEVGAEVYVLVGGNVEVWAGGQRVRTIPAPDAGAIWSDGQKAWVTVAEWRAVPVERLAAPAPVVGTVPAAAPVAPAAAPGGARVSRVDDGAVVVDRSLPVGTQVRVFGTRDLSERSLDGSGRTRRSVEQVVAAGRVRVAESERSLVDLARGGRAAEGDRVEVAPDVYRYPLAPERLGDVGEVGVVVRPVLGLDTIGVGFLNEVWGTWSFEAPWYAQVRVSPLGLGVAKEGNPLSVAAVATGGYDSRYFSVGLGVGWSMLNGSAVNGYNAMEDSGVTVEFHDVKGAFAVVQEARLGARDGLSLAVRNTFLLVPTYTWTYPDSVATTYGYESEGTIDVQQTGREFSYGGLAMTLTVPTGDRTDLFADGTFGDAGALWIEGGVSTWLRGNGDAGSVALNVAAGYGSITGYVDERTTEISGPMVSIGARYRF